MQRSLKFLLALALAAAGLSLSACVGTLPATGVVQLKELEASYRRGDYHATIVAADDFLDAYGGTESAGEAYYIRGLAYVASRDRDAGTRAQARDKARADFEQAIKSANRSDLAPLANVALGNLAFEEGRLVEAANRYQPVIEANKLPNDAGKDVVLYRLGVCYTRLGQWRPGRTWFSQLLALFPNSEMEPAARRYLAAESFSIQCGAYPDRDSAAKKVDRLRAGGLADARWVQDAGMKYFLVQAGSYETYQEARTGLALAVRAAPGAIIVP